MEVLLQNLLKRAKELYPEDKDFFTRTSPHLLPFFEKNVTLSDYLALDDGVMNTYFQLWMTSPDKILADLSQRFVNRKVFKSITFSQEDQDQLASLRKLVRTSALIPTTTLPFIRTLTSLMISIVPNLKIHGHRLRFYRKMVNWPNSLACLLSSNPLLVVVTEIIVSIFRKKCWIKTASLQVLPSNFYT